MLNQQPATSDTFVLPKDPDQALNATMKTIEELQDIYERETENLQKANTKGFLALQDEKLQKTQVYHASIKQILKRKEEMQSVNPALKQRLHDMQATFSEISKKNLEEIQRMQRTVDRLGNTIRKAAKDAARKIQGYSYGETGQIEGEEKRRVSIGVSETA